MMAGSRVILCCLMVLCCALAEGRWQELRNPRRQLASLEQRPAEESLARLVEERHGRRRAAESDESDESTEEVDTPRSPTRMEFDGDPDYLGEEPAPRRRQKKHHRRHRAHHRRKPPSLGELGDELYLEYDAGAELSRDKRHQRRKNWTDEDWKAFESSRRPELYDHDIHVFELEVRDAQNSSLCNYTVVPIPDPGGRVPRVLEHVKCNYVGNRCRERGSYCCVQTYRNVEVTYPNNRNDTIKVYSGCVCALQIYGTLKPYNPKLPLDD